MYEYRCKIVRIIDGDTVVVDIDLGFDIWLKDESVRFLGMDAPEVRTRDQVEKLFGEISKAYVEKMIPVGSMQIVKTERPNSRGKFGRVLGTFRIYDEKTDRWTSLSEVMIREGYGVAYEGGNREALRESLLGARKKLIETGVVKMTLEEAGLTK